MHAHSAMEVASSSLLVRCEAIKMVGVLPFLAWVAWAALCGTTGTRDAKLIAFFVTINGVLCHLSSALRWTWRHAWRVVDMGCNAVFIVYVNVRSPWAWTRVLTLVALVGWQASRPSASLANAWTHVVFVQWTLLWCLVEYHPTSGCCEPAGGPLLLGDGASFDGLRAA